MIIQTLSRDLSARHRSASWEVVNTSINEIGESFSKIYLWMEQGIISKSSYITLNEELSDRQTWLYFLLDFLFIEDES